MTDGTLFEYILSEEGIRADELIHIGDTPGADIEPAKKKGIKTCYCASLNEEMKKDPAQEFFRQILSDKKIPPFIAGVSAYYNFKHGFKNKFFELGFKIGGPMALGYSNFIYRKSKNEDIDRILFVSRDGDTLRKVFNSLYPDFVRNNYIYASRSVILHILDYDTNFPVYEENAKKIFLKETGAKEFCKSAYQEWLRSGRQEYLKYLNKNDVKGKRIATVDLTTGGFSAAKLAKNIFKDRYKLSFCSLRFGDFKGVSIDSYCQHMGTIKDEKHAVLIEELLSSSEYSCREIKNGKPVFQEYSLLEEKRIENYRYIEQGIIAFIDQIKDIFGEKLPDITYEQVALIMDAYMRSLRIGDVRTLKNMFHSDPYNPPTNQTVYDYLNRSPINLNNKHPLREVCFYSSFKNRKRALLNKLSFGLYYKGNSDTPQNRNSIDLSKLTKYCLLQFIPKYKRKLCFLLNQALKD